MGLDSAVKRAKEKVSFTRKIEVEVESVEDAISVAELDVDIIMLDNMSAAEVRTCVKLLNERAVRDRVIVEASGGMDIDNIKEFASTGVDVISIGMITHSARWLGFSMNVV